MKRPYRVKSSEIWVINGFQFEIQQEGFMWAGEPYKQGFCFHKPLLAKTKEELIEAIRIKTLDLVITDEQMKKALEG